ncbi:MAG TPA: Gldg family protein [Lacunisphaera sp.]|nr:Gldg family protein [Lacunisphaera sp.]
MKFGRIPLTIALLFVGLVAVNYLASALPYRVDATAEHIYSLSPGTHAILDKLEEPVRLDFYFSASTAGLPISIKNYAARVQEMLRQYVRASHGHLELVVTDPKPDTPAEEKATAAGVAGQPLSNGDRVYFGLVATLADQQQVIAFFSPQREQFLEYDLSQVIYRIQQFNRPKLGLLTSLPLRGAMDMMAMQSGRMPRSQLVLSEWERSFEIVDVQASATELPAGLDALAIIHPQNVSEKLQFAIDQFLLAGKPVFLAVDPSSRTMADQGQRNGMMGGPPPGTASDLPKLLGGWGLEYKPADVIGDPDNATPVQTGAGVVSRLPIWINLTSANLNRTALPTSQLRSLLFIEPGAVALKPGSALTFTPLATTSAQSGTVPAMTLQFSPPEEAGKDITASGSKTIAALVEGKFKSAFPDGLPADEPAKNVAPKDGKPADAAKVAIKDAAKPGVATLKESKTKSTLIIVADSDWLMDDYSVRRMSFLGMQSAEPLNDNLAFASNAIEFLSGSQDLISIRGKASSDRPFTVVRRMEAEAQRQYQERLTALEARLTEVQNKLTELQGKKTEGNRLIATPEMEKAIDEFQKQESEMRGERRQIRAALRHGIEVLENSLIVINLLAPAVIVILFGLWYHRQRRHSAGSAPKVP